LVYLQLKWLHIGLAALSVAGFTLRWVWMMRGSDRVHHRLTRVLPHVFDTLFLASGIALAVLLRINPLVHHWLAAKLCGLVAYILLASLAYSRVRSRRLRIVLFALALVTYAWILSVARLKTPLGALALI